MNTIIYVFAAIGVLATIAIVAWLGLWWYYRLIVAGVVCRLLGHRNIEVADIHTDDDVLLWCRRCERLA